jgi:hypothetical protein
MPCHYVDGPDVSNDRSTLMFQGSCCQEIVLVCWIPEDEVSRSLRNVGNQPRNDTASYSDDYTLQLRGSAMLSLKQPGFIQLHPSTVSQVQVNSVITS